MNNSQITQWLYQEEEEITSPVLADREAKLVRYIQDLQVIQKSNEWSSLKEVFDPLRESLEKQILAEAKKTNPDTNRLNRLTGELTWAVRYSDLKKLEQEFRVELANIRLKLYGKTPKES